MLILKKIKKWKNEGKFFLTAVKNSNFILFAIAVLLLSGLKMENFD